MSESEEEIIRFECNKEQIIKDFEEVKEFVHDMRENNMYLTYAERIALQSLELYIKDSIPNAKIREKIKEINNEKLNYSDDEYYLENEMKGYAIDKIQELLEENRWN